jgi:hypothetical protein
MQPSFSNICKRSYRNIISKKRHRIQKTFTKNVGSGVLLPLYNTVPEFSYPGAMA